MASVNQDRDARTTTSIRFSTTHGQNVQVENHGKSASWSLNKHYGTCFTNRSLNKGENVKFKLAGSGHVRLGLLSVKPHPSAIENMDATAIEHSSHWTHFRFKKETTSVSLSRVKSREVLFTRGYKEDKSIPVPNQDLYVFFEIQFGNISIDIETDEVKKPISFDSSCGANITLEQQQSRAKLKNMNVSAKCCSDRPLAPEEIIDLNVENVDDATWTYAKLYVSNKNAGELKINKIDISGGNNSFLFPTEGIKLDKRGTVQLRLTETGEISYSVKTEQKTIDMAGSNIDLSLPVFLFVELFRVKVELQSTFPGDHEETYLKAIDATDKTYITLIPDTENNRASYLEPAPEKEREHHYEKLNTAFPEVARSARGDEPPPGSTQNTEGNIKMYTPGMHNQATTPKTISDDDSITTQKELHTQRPPVKEPITNGKSLPKGVRRDVGQFPSVSGDAEASGPLHPPPVPPRLPTTGSSGPDVPYTNTSPAIPMQPAPILNLIARVEVLENNTGLPVPSAESPVGTSGQEVPPFAEMIRRNYIPLLNRLEPDPVADYLFQEGKMSIDEHRSFFEKDRKGKCRLVLEILQKRPSSKGIFITALNDSSQKDLLSLFTL